MNNEVFLNFNTWIYTALFQYLTIICVVVLMLKLNQYIYYKNLIFPYLTQKIKQNIKSK